MAEPIYKISLTGNQEVAEFSNEYSWTKGPQYEQKFYLKLADGAKTLDYSLVDNIRIMHFSSDSPFTVTLSTATASIPLAVQDFLSFSPTTATAALITSITITASTTTDQVITVEILGETVS
jgi:hypothetical protein